MPNVDMIGPSDTQVNRGPRPGASGVPVSAATWHLAAHGVLRDDHDKHTIFNLLFGPLAASACGFIRASP
jgi:hypothetical protein